MQPRACAALGRSTLRSVQHRLPDRSHHLHHVKGDPSATRRPKSSVPVNWSDSADPAPEANDAPVTKPHPRNGCVQTSPRQTHEFLLIFAPSFPSCAGRPQDHVKGDTRRCITLDERDRLASSRMIPSDESQSHRTFPSTSMRVLSTTQGRSPTARISGPPPARRQVDRIRQSRCAPQALMPQSIAIIEHPETPKNTTSSSFHGRSERRRKLTHFQQITVKNRPDNTPTPLA